MWAEVRLGLTAHKVDASGRLQLPRTSQPKRREAFSYKGPSNPQHGHCVGRPLRRTSGSKRGAEHHSLDDEDDGKKIALQTSGVKSCKYIRRLRFRAWKDTCSDSVGLCIAALECTLYRKSSYVHCSLLVGCSYTPIGKRFAGSNACNSPSGSRLFCFTVIVLRHPPATAACRARAVALCVENNMVCAGRYASSAQPDQLNCNHCWLHQHVIAACNLLSAQLVHVVTASIRSLL